MKIKFLMAGLLGLISATTFAQKGELSSAQTNYDTYTATRSTPVLSVPKINAAKVSIDKASANEKTANLPQTFALKAAIYGSLAEMDTVETTSTPLYNTAAEALKKAKELDAKGENKKLIEESGLTLAQYQRSKGVKEYQSGKYELAYKSFDNYRQILPEDTSAMLYTGLSAFNAKNYPAAISNYSKLVTTKYSGSEGIYNELTNAYLLNKDTTNALKAIGEGVTKFPSSGNLRKKEIEMNLVMGKQKEVLDKVQGAIANDPKNKELYYYAGLVYSQTGDNAAPQITAAKDPATKSALQLKRTQDYTKAGEMYKKALELDPNYFEANLNLGYVLLAPAIETFNNANKLPANKQKEYEAGIAKSATLFDLAKPYLVKAVELQPKNPDAVANLLTYYKGKKDDANIAKYNKILADLRK